MIFYPSSGGGSVDRSKLTSKLSDVLKGVIAITSDSGDEGGEGTLALTGNAGTGDVVSGKGFYTTDPKTKQTGTLADKNGTIQSATATLDTTNSRVQLTIPVTGRYNTAAKLYVAYSTLASLIGLTAAKIATGNTILGLAGTYKGLGDAVASQVLAGKKFSTASLSNATGTMADRTGWTHTFTPTTSQQNQTVPSGWHTGGYKVYCNAIPTGVTTSFISAGGKNDHSTYSGKSTDSNKVSPNGTLSFSKSTYYVTKLADLKSNGVSGLTINETSYMYDFYFESSTSYYSHNSCAFLARPVRCDYVSSVTAKVYASYKCNSSSESKSFYVQMRLGYFNDDSTKLEAYTAGTRSYFSNETSNTTAERTLTMTLDDTYKKTYKWVAVYIIFIANTGESGSFLVTLYSGTGITALTCTT